MKILRNRTTSKTKQTKTGQGRTVERFNFKHRDKRTRYEFLVWKKSSVFIWIVPHTAKSTCFKKHLSLTATGVMGLLQRSKPVGYSWKFLGVEEVGEVFRLCDLGYPTREKYGLQSTASERISGWWWIFPLGISSSQLTNIFFQRAWSTTNQISSGIINLDPSHRCFH